MRQSTIIAVLVALFFLGGCTTVIQFSTDDPPPYNLEGFKGRPPKTDGGNQHSTVMMKRVSKSGDIVVLRNEHTSRAIIKGHAYGLDSDIAATFLSDMTVEPGAEVSVEFPGSLNESRFSGKGLYYQVNYSLADQPGSFVWDSRYDH